MGTPWANLLVLLAETVRTQVHKHGEVLEVCLPCREKRSPEAWVLISTLTLASWVTEDKSKGPSTPLNFDSLFSGNIL